MFESFYFYVVRFAFPVFFFFFAFLFGLFFLGGCGEECFVLLRKGESNMAFFSSFVILFVWILVSIPPTSPSCFDRVGILSGDSTTITLGINSTFSQFDNDYCPPSTPVCVKFQAGVYVLSASNAYVSDQNVASSCDSVQGEGVCGCRANGRCCSRGFQQTFLMYFEGEETCDYGGTDPIFNCTVDPDFCIRQSNFPSNSNCNQCCGSSCCEGCDEISTCQVFFFSFFFRVNLFGLNLNSILPQLRYDSENRAGQFQQSTTSDFLTIEDGPILFSSCRY